jgi:hypothetical protein
LAAFVLTVRFRGLGFCDGDAFLRPPLSLGYVNFPTWALIMLLARFMPLERAAAHRISVDRIKRFMAFMALLL